VGLKPRAFGSAKYGLRAMNPEGVVPKRPLLSGLSGPGIATSQKDVLAGHGVDCTHARSRNGTSTLPLHSIPFAPAAWPTVLQFRLSHSINIQQPTSNPQPPMTARPGAAGCSMLDVGCSPPSVQWSDARWQFATALPRPPFPVSPLHSTLLKQNYNL
jgi:hypothetical protein